MFDLRRRSTLHRGTGVARSDGSDLGVRSSKIMFKSCLTESDRLRPPENVTVTINHMIPCNARLASTAIYTG